MRLEFNALGRAPGLYTLIIGVDMMAAMGRALKSRGDRTRAGVTALLLLAGTL